MSQPLTYRALVAREAEDGTVKCDIETLPFDFLPDHPVVIKVKWAALNYKDALSATGHRGVTRAYPHTPGVDASGEVVSDATGTFEPGTEVICTSFDLGMNTPGGFAEYIRVPAEWVVPLPKGLDLRQSMIYGTAAYTAGLALFKMEQCGQKPAMGPVAITGATGGVGSMAVALLAAQGYEVHAVTGKSDQAEYLYSLGAAKILSRDAVDDQSGRPLLRSQWAGAIDNVGGNTLSTLLKACGRNGNVASIGLVSSPNLQTTVYPFILNGVNLLGVDSAETPISLRHEIWSRLSGNWQFSLPQGAVTETDLEGISTQMTLILSGKTKGRVLCTLS